MRVSWRSCARTSARPSSARSRQGGDVSTASRQGQRAREAFAAVARERGARFDEILRAELDDLGRRIVSAFRRPGGNRGELWERLAYPHCWHRGDDDAQRRLDVLVPPAEGRRIVYWPDHPCGGAFVFDDLTRAMAVLEEANWSELLVTDEELTFLLIYSDHRIVYAMGSAMELLDRAYGEENVALFTGEDDAGGDDVEGG